MQHLWSAATWELQVDEDASDESMIRVPVTILSLDSSQRRRITQVPIPFYEVPSAKDLFLITVWYVHDFLDRMHISFSDPSGIELWHSEPKPKSKGISTRALDVIPIGHLWYSVDRVYEFNVGNDRFREGIMQRHMLVVLVVLGGFVLSAQGDEHQHNPFAHFPACSTEVMLDYSAHLEDMAYRVIGVMETMIEAVPEVGFDPLLVDALMESYESLPRHIAEIPVPPCAEALEGFWLLHEFMSRGFMSIILGNADQAAAADRAGASMEGAGKRLAEIIFFAG